MTALEWHSDGPHGEDRNWLRLLDMAPESAGIDLAAVRRYRQDRVRAEMAKRDIAAVILSDAVNVRYATVAETCRSSRPETRRPAT